MRPGGVGPSFQLVLLDTERGADLENLPAILAVDQAGVLFWVVSPGLEKPSQIREIAHEGNFAVCRRLSIRIDSAAGRASFGGMSAPLNELVPVLQVAISPVILISGVGLLLLSLSNRFGRAVDRSRQLAREMRQLPPSDQQRLSEQVRILYRRAALIQWAITMAAISVLLAAVLIISLFLIALMGWKSGVLPLSALFIGCMLSLILSLLAFLREIHWSLTALKLELEPPAEG